MPSPRLLGLLLLLVWSATTPARGQEHTFRLYTIDDGLAQSQVQAMVQDPSGPLWIATNGGGLNRFDGRTFTTFTRSDGLVANTLTALAIDAHDRLWVGTSQGLNRLTGNRSFQTVLPEARITALAPDADGGVWVGTAQQGLRYVVGDTLRRPAWADTLGAVRSLHHSPNTGVLWIGTPQGLCRWGEEVLACFDQNDGLPAPAISALSEDASGRLWIGTSAGVASYARGQLTAEPAFGRTAITALLVDRTGTVWAGTSGGALLWDGQALERLTTRNGLEHDSVLSLFQDREQNVWIGVDGSGLNQYLPTPFTRFTTRHGLPEDIAWAIHQDEQGAHWFGTHGGGVARLDGTTFTTYTTADGLSSDVVYTLLSDDRGRLWAGTDVGLDVYDGRRFRPAPSPIPRGAIWALTRTVSGGLWIGTAQSGLVRYENDRVIRYTTDDGLPSNTITSLYADPDSTLWIGTDIGVARFDGDTFTSLTVADGLPHPEVTAVMGTDDGRLWVGTYGGGLVSFFPPEAGLSLSSDAPTLRVLTSTDGLSNDAVLSMTVDLGGDLWVCTNDGLNRIGLDAYAITGQPHVTAYGPDAGFAGRECNSGAAFTDRAGHLWFGTVKGITRYQPQMSTPPLVSPAVHIRDARLFFEPVDWTEYGSLSPVAFDLPADLVLDPEDNHLTFDYNAVSLRAPRRVRFQYKMAGLDRAWTPPTRETYATYANLPPGTYTFMVRAGLENGPWSGMLATYTFKVRAPFWKTWWFLLLMVGFLGGGAVSAVRMRERQLRGHQLHLQRVVRQRTHELRAEKEKVVHAYEELAHSHLELEQLSLVARETDNAVLITDAEGRIEWVNEGFTRLTGFTLEQLRTERGHTLQAVSRKEDIARLIAYATETHQSVVYESVLSDRKDQDLWLSTTLTPILDADGQLRRFVVIDTDITQRKKLEEEQIAAREAAQEAARIKSEFLANMSHEIRTPMNGVIGMTNLLLDTPLSARQREFTQIIRTSGEALLDIINDILDFSKIEAGRIDLEAHPFPIHDAVEEALDLVATRAAEKGLELAYLIEATVPSHVVSDLTRLRQILTNLLSNAVKFTAEGEVVVQVGARPLDDGQHELHFSVRDTGIGIPADRMHVLFDSFSQVDASTTRKFGGTGLGLAISKRLAELLGGRMWVESEEGVGSTFHFTVQAVAAPTQGRLRARAQNVSLDGKRVLIVDDNATNRRMLSLQVESWGMTALTVDGPQAALTQTSNTFDVAILDMQMPEMDGLTLATHLRAAWPETPFVMLSSIGLRSDLENTPFSAWLTKPTKKTQLFETLTHVLAEEGAAPSGATSIPSTPMFDGTLALRHPLRILLAEDNPLNQKVALRLLERLGYRADVAANGLEVLDAVAKRPYDLVLMDIQMPEMDGLDATERILAESAAGERPYLVAMTANATSQDRDRCLEAGLDDYLSKPVNVERLVDVLQQCPQRGREAFVPDLSALHRMVGDDPEFFHDMVQSFLNDAPRQLREMEQAAEQEDLDALSRAAHSLKSTSRMFGAHQLALQCAAIEDEPARALADDAFPRLREQVDTVLQGVRAHLQAAGRPAL